jgi:hypothetical protein
LNLVWGSVLASSGKIELYYLFYVHTLFLSTSLILIHFCVNKLNPKKFEKISIFKIMGST